ncbi:MAG: hypothetical protein RDV48_17630 [Candidatus Eremiobacteraeota bacterium]|nr:hypothetical protein [Candidatus Eremiobacteraeota bacterium]
MNIKKASAPFFLFITLLLLSSLALPLPAQEYEVRITFIEPIEGAICYPGNKLFINLQVRDLNERVKGVAFYVAPPNTKRPAEPFFFDRNGADGWYTTYVVPADAAEGWYRISAQAFDKNGIKKGREVFVPVQVKKPQVAITITAPRNDQKIYCDQPIFITGALQDRAAIVKRVDFFVYRASSQAQEQPSFSDTRLEGGCRAKILLPKAPPDEYEVLLRAFDSKEGGSAVAEAKTRFLLVQPEVQLRIIEPRRGGAFYPGQKIHMYGELRDPAKKVKKVLFYLFPSTKEKKEKPAPFAQDTKLLGGFSAEYVVPYETAFGAHTIAIEAVGDDEKAPPLAADEESIMVNKPVIALTIRVPAANSVHYGDEDLYINADLGDRAGIVERVAFIVYPQGEPMKTLFTFHDKIFTDGCGTIFKLPAKIKPGKYVLEATAKDQKGTALLTKHVTFEIKE